MKGFFVNGRETKHTIGCYFCNYSKEFNPNKETPVSTGEKNICPKCGKGNIPFLRDREGRLRGVKE